MIREDSSTSLLPNNSLSQSSILWHLLALILPGALYILLRTPMAPLSFSYYDDGENLYHALALLEGKIPYLQDFNHHFAGYLLPLVLLAKLFGFSADLFSTLFVVQQVVVGYLVFLIVRRFTIPLWSLFGALVAVSAREPWVLGHFIQYELNPLWLLSLLFALSFISKGSLRFLALSFFISGIAFTFDQRALFFSIIPFGAWTLSKRGTLLRWIASLFIAGMAWGLAPLTAILYLFSHGALIPFYEQTFVFPSQYRVGGSSLTELLFQGLSLHRYLFTLSSLLFIGALASTFTIILQKRYRDSTYTLLFFAAIPHFIFPFFGGRDYEYYTVTWLPWMAIVSALLPSLLVDTVPALVLTAAKALVASPILTASLGAMTIAMDDSVQAYQGDGAREAAEFLRVNAQPSDQIYLLGYRLDLFAHLGRTEGLPFSSQIFYTPDSDVPSEQYELHTYPQYRSQFEDVLTNTPPQWIVIFNTSELIGIKRPIESFVLSLVASRYEKAYTITRNDFRDKVITFEVYKKRPEA